MAGNEWTGCCGGDSTVRRRKTYVVKRSWTSLTDLPPGHEGTPGLSHAAPGIMPQE